MQPSCQDSVSVPELPPAQKAPETPPPERTEPPKKKKKVNLRKRLGRILAELSYEESDDDVPLVVEDYIWELGLKQLCATIRPGSSYQRLCQNLGVPSSKASSRVENPELHKSVKSAMKNLPELNITNVTNDNKRS